MNNKEINFELRCDCGDRLFGYFSKEDEAEKIHCPCGLIWEIVRPYEKTTNGY